MTTYVPTPIAEKELSCSGQTLKRKRDSHGGFLVAGKHYVLGPSLSSPILWNVELVREAFHKRGMAIRKQLQGS